MAKAIRAYRHQEGGAGPLAVAGWRNLQSVQCRTAGTEYRASAALPMARRCVLSFTTVKRSALKAIVMVIIGGEILGGERGTEWCTNRAIDYGRAAEREGEE